MSENYTFDVACKHIKGVAHNWLIYKRSIFHSWSDFRIAFKKSCIPEHNEAELWSRMRDRKQKPDVNIAAYFHDKLIKICKILGLSFPEIKEHVAASLTSHDMAVYVVNRLCG